MNRFTPSKYQKRIFEEIKNGNTNIIINAVAGSGKTTTIVKALEIIPDDKEVLFLAFNKSIATELKTRVPRNVKAATFHSVGFAVLRAVLRRVEVGTN